ncbi:MAG: kynureninase, partial [Woeseiaceae bacterium]|nr:kynureninase [Woeseiaceae bacterium]
DPLRSFRDEFNFPDARHSNSCIYLCGNSLGLQPRLAVRLVDEELEDWGRLAVLGHLQGRRPWLPYHRQATDGIAELTGARPQEVVSMNTLTVNLHLMMTSFYRPTRERRKILIESTAFPSDRFAVMSQLQLHGGDPRTDLIEWQPREGEHELKSGDLARLLADHGHSIALMLLPGVQYYSGQVLDMPELCRLANDAGCRIGLDLAHAIGNVPLELHDWAPDFAVWCSYKYLNAGPGAIAGAFVHERNLGDASTPRLLGWWGHDEATRFQMAANFTPARGAEHWQLSNPPILSFAPLLASLQIFHRAGMHRLRMKSERLTSYLAESLQQRFGGRVLSITPENARGCQLSLQVVDRTRDARRVFESLEEQNVIADWREPNVIRVAPVPLYNSYEDVYEFVQRLGIALDA